MYLRHGSGPRGPLDDDWLFTDPMAIELAGGDDVGLPADWPAAADPKPLCRRDRRLALMLVLAVGAAAAAVVSGPWHEETAGAAAACPPGAAAGTGQAPLAAG